MEELLVRYIQNDNNENQVCVWKLSPFSSGSRPVLKGSGGC